MMTSLTILPLFLGNLRGTQLIIIIVLALLLFGGVAKIPSLMRNLGKGVHAFKQGIEDAKEEMNKPVVKAGTKKDADASDESVDTPAKAKDVD